MWAQLAKFNQYSFCKSHAVSYGLIAWQAAWLKTHHPVAFWTAALNNNQSSYPHRVYVEAMKRAGIRVLLPCVNRSAGPFRPEDGAVRVGLGAIAGLPEEVREALLQERGRNGPFADLGDLVLWIIWRGWIVAGLFIFWVSHSQMSYVKCHAIGLWDAREFT